MPFYPFSGTCARGVEFEIDNRGRLQDISFLGGCPGNTRGVAALAEGRRADDIAHMLKGTDCGGKGTSCPDQFALAIEAELAKRGGITLP